MYKIVIIDDNELTRKSIAKTIKRQLPDCAIVGRRLQRTGGLKLHTVCMSRYYYQRYQNAGPGWPVHGAHGPVIPAGFSDYFYHRLSGFRKCPCCHQAACLCLPVETNT